MTTLATVLTVVTNQVGYSRLNEEFFVEYICQVRGPVRILASTARTRDTLALRSQVPELTMVYVVCVIFSDVFYMVLSISRGAMLRWVRRTSWRLSKSLQGNRRGVSHETRCRIKDSKGGESHSYSSIFFILIRLPRVPKSAQVISHLPTKRRSGSKEMFKSWPKKSRFKKRKSRVFEVNEQFNMLGISAELCRYR